MLSLITARNSCEVQQLLAKVLDGTPQVKTYEVSHSTVHKIAAHVTA